MTTVDTPEQEAIQPPEKTPSREERKQALREQLRNGRIREISGASEDSSGDGGNDDITSGSTFESASRAIESIASKRRRSKDSTGASRDSVRGSNGRFIRRGQPSRRPGESDGGLDTDTTAPGGRIIGNVFTEDKEPPRLNLEPEAEFYREEPAPARPGPAAKKRGRPLKEKIAESAPVKALKNQKSVASLVLTEQEAVEYQESLKSILEDDFDAIDRYLWKRQKLYTPDKADDMPVWSNMTEREIATLIRVMIKAGRHNPAMATVVRAVVDSHDYIQLVTILAPRSTETWRVMKETHKPPVKRAERGRQA